MKQGAQPPPAAEAVVIGGGIIGLATAYHLCEKGIGAVLVEKGVLAQGSTGRCLGGIRKQFTNPTKIKVARESVRMFGGMEAKLGMPVDWKPGGYLILAHEENKVETLQEELAAFRKLGLRDVRWAQPDECAEIVPGLNTEGLLGATWSPTDGQADPFKVVRAYSRGIQRLGGAVISRAEATDIGYCEGAVGSVKVNGVRGTHKIKTDIVVNAAGAYASRVGDLLNRHLPEGSQIPIPVHPERHEGLVTEGTEPVFEPLIIDLRSFRGLSRNAYFMQNNLGQVIGCFTPYDDPATGVAYPNFKGPHTSSSKEFLVEMARRIVQLVPKLSNVRVRRQWGGSYPMSPTGLPIIDKTGVDGYFVSVGYCGHGFMLAPRSGQLTAELIADGKPSINLDQWSLDVAWRTEKGELDLGEGLG